MFSSFAWDHPRVCGEHSCDGINKFRQLGSSPRMRGTLVPRNWYRWGVGIIPAYAGNTSINVVTQTVTGDHPRVCGEHVRAQIINGLRKGSSPRMRGPLTYGTAHDFIPRIIPAYAGNTPSLSRESTWTGDHPRVCGEHRWIGSMARPMLGSSPRMRGTH